MGVEIKCVRLYAQTADDRAMKKDISECCVSRIVDDLTDSFLESVESPSDIAWPRTTSKDLHRLLTLRCAYKTPEVFDQQDGCPKYSQPNRFEHLSIVAPPLGGRALADFLLRESLDHVADAERVTVAHACCELPVDMKDYESVRSSTILDTQHSEMSFFIARSSAV